MSVIEQGLPQQEVSITIGNIPNFVNVVILQDNLLSQFDTYEDFLSVTLEDDKNSVCEEKIASIRYKGENKEKHIKGTNGVTV